MAVAFDARSQSHASGSTSTNQASFSWNHTPVGTPRGVLVFTFSAGTTDIATSVTYGGVSLTAVSGGRTSASGTFPCDVKAWFLGSGLLTGAQTIVVNRTNNATAMWAVAFTVTAAIDTSVHEAGIVLDSQSVLDGPTSIRQKSVTDGQSSGVNNSVRFAGIAAEATSFASFGTSTPTAGLIYPGANSTDGYPGDPGGVNDLANLVLFAVRESVAGIGARNVGFYFDSVNTLGNTMTLAAVHLAVKEGGGGTVVGDLLLSPLGGTIGIGGTGDAGLGLVFV